jgi:hypothetical protein
LFIESNLAPLSVLGSSPAPDKQFISTMVLEALAAKGFDVAPLKAAYDAWWKDMSEDIQTAYFEATKPASWAHVSAHLAAAAPFMLATHKRNLDKDCWGITELEYSPINSDVVESGFGHLDLCIRSLHGTPIQGCIGVAHAAMLKAFATDAGKRQAAKAAARMEARATGTKGGGAADEAVVQAKLAAWETTSFFKLPRAERWKLITDIQFRYKTVVVAADRANAEAEATGRVDRLKAKAAAHVLLFLNRAGNRDKHMQIAPCTSLAGLAALGAGKSVKDHLQAMRDQIRVRVHVYEIKAATLPAIGDRDSTEELERLVEALKAIVVLPLPRLPPPPLPYPVRPTHPAPTAEATALDVQHMVMISDAITQLMRLTSAGSFKAVRSKVPRRRSARAPVAPKAPRARSANAAALALVGAEFEDELISWKVVGVDWSAELEQVVVWYYDVAMAADLEIDENEMTLARKTGVDLAPLECSSTSEVRRWIKESARE